MTLKDIETTLRDGGLKVTPRRVAIARMLLRSGRATTPDQVWRRLRPGLGRLGLPSVYRILEELSGVGLLTRIELDDRVLRYAACTAGPGHHHHIVCSRCGRVEVVDCGFPASSRRAIKRRTGFRVTSHTMQVEGLCPDCQGRKA
jgi:Fe2+ or Zn2+ uptake regulation protein